MRLDAMLDGGLLAIPEQSADVMSELEELLTYTRRVLADPTSGNRMENVRISCFAYDGGPDFGVVRRMVFPYGYRRKVEQFLATRGIRLNVIDVSPERWRRPKTFQFDWRRLSDVDWKWLQREIISKLLKYRFAQVKTCTGYGKSFMIRCLCQGLTNSRIVVTSHSTDVVRQLHREIARVVPSTGLITGEKRYGEQCRVVVCSGKSLHRVEHCPDLLMVDEGHEFGTDDYVTRVAQGFRYSRRYMFSANCGDRMDGADFELDGIFGPIVIRIPYQDAVSNGCVVPINVRWVRVHSRFRLIPPGVTNRTAVMRLGVWANVLRNNAIAAAARAFSGDQQVLIVVDKIEHAVRLKHLLPEFTLVYGENGMDFGRRRRYVDRGLLESSEPAMTPARRQWLSREFSAGRLQRVIATGVWNRGVDFKSLSVLIRADGLVSPIANTQIPGRVSRTHDEIGKQAGLIVDFTDEYDPEFVNRAKARRKQYAVHGWPQALVDPVELSTHACRGDET